MNKRILYQRLIKPTIALLWLLWEGVPLEEDKETIVSCIDTLVLYKPKG